MAKNSQITCSFTVWCATHYSKHSPKNHAGYRCDTHLNEESFIEFIEVIGWKYKGHWLCPACAKAADNEEQGG